jgi:hypothetical protein
MTLISKTEQTIGEARSTVAVNDDDVQAGYNDVALTLNAAGGFLSFPVGASLGSLKFYASNNAGNFAHTITNASFAQATAFTIPDPGASTANFIVSGGIQQMAATSQLYFGKANGTESGNAVTASGQSGVITTSALTTAGAGSYAITWTNTHFTPSSVVILTPAGGTNTTQDFKATVEVSNGTALLIINNLTAATVLNGTILLNYLVV